MTVDATRDATPVRDRSARIAPRLVAGAAAILPLALLAQFGLAGLSLYENGTIWAWHAGLGVLVALPVAVLAGGALTRPSVRPLRWWALMLAALYVVQVVSMVVGQASGSGLLQALHPLNGGLMLVAALVIAAKIARSHSG